jgi:hypothetical protein
MLASPGPDVRRPLAVRAPCRRATLGPACPASVLDEWTELLSKRAGVLLAQVDLVLNTGQAEVQRFGRRAAVKIVFI